MLSCAHRLSQREALPIWPAGSLSLSLTLSILSGGYLFGWQVRFPCWCVFSISWRVRSGTRLGGHRDSVRSLVGSKLSRFLSLSHSHFPLPSLAESLSFVVSPCAFPLEAPSQQCTSVRQCVCVAYRLSRRTPLTCAVLGLTKGTPVDPSREPFLLRLPWPSSTTRLSTAPCLTRRHLDPFSP